jgi:biotin carboxyl carrier protein
VRYFVRVNGRPHTVDLRERLGELAVEVDGRPIELAYEEVDHLGQVALFAGGRVWGLSIEGDDNAVSATLAGHLYAVEIEDERERAAHAAEGRPGRGGGVIRSVMPGVVARILVEPGETVAAGQALVILEAMKMQNEIPATGAAVVAGVHVSAGQAVESGAALVTLEAVPDQEED